MSKVIAILCSDIHIESCPSWRSAEPDWFKAMARSLDELRSVAEKHQAPVICAGDIFTRWWAGPELINFAIEHLPHMYCVRGNHDLPNHRHEEIERSAYWTLVQADKITDLIQPYAISEELTLHPFNWGKEIVPLDSRYKSSCPEMIHLAVVHKYIWKEGYGHTGADENAKASKFKEALRGYDASVFGDNHKGFLIGKPGQHMLMNCGTFFRRHSDEIDYKPQIGLLYDDGSISPHYLDISKDLYVEADTNRGKKAKIDASVVLEGFRGLGKDALDFRAGCRRELDRRKSDEVVTEMVLKSIG